jgi:serine O-acetyltransferase
LLNKISEILFGITIGVEAKIGKRLVIEHFGAIVIHGKTVIGDDCIIRQGVTIGNKTMNKPHDAPTLGNNVNVGAGAKILGKVIIGNNVDIGANAVVINDVPDNYIAVGVPAKLIKK